MISTITSDAPMVLNEAAIMAGATVQKRISLQPDGTVKKTYITTFRKPKPVAPPKPDPKLTAPPERYPKLTAPPPASPKPEPPPKPKPRAKRKKKKIECPVCQKIGGKVFCSKRCEAEAEKTEERIKKLVSDRKDIFDTPSWAYPSAGERVKRGAPFNTSVYYEHNWDGTISDFP